MIRYQVIPAHGGLYAVAVAGRAALSMSAASRILPGRYPSPMAAEAMAQALQREARLARDYGGTMIK